MSYLDTPRLTFAGRFQADISTINNDPQHYDVATFRSEYQLTQPPGPHAPADGWYNPGGSGAWRFFDCTVTSVTLADGTYTADGARDQVIGMPVGNSPDRAPGRLVDLDPEMQMMSEIWGFQVSLGADAAWLAATGRQQPGLAFVGDFEPAPFADIWPRAVTGGGDISLSAIYQSVLTSVRWQDNELFRSSPLLQQLRKASGDKLSIKFNVDGISHTPGPDFLTGRVVGTIGPWEKGEPEHLVLGRHLLALGQSAQNATAVLADRQLTVDLGNSLPTTGPGGALVDQGPVTLFVGAGAAIAELNGYAGDDWYTQTAGIATFELAADHAKAARNKPLALGWVPAGASTPSPVLTEASDGVWVHADQFVFRLDYGETRHAEFWATRWGRPTSTSISLVLDSSQEEGFLNQIPGQTVPGPPVGTPEDGVVFKKKIKTGRNGQARLALKGNLTTYPRRYIDGQIYGIAYAAGDKPPAQGANSVSETLGVLVFTKYDVPAQPTWIDHVAPILTQYANLYPVMKPLVDLADYASVVSKTAALRGVFSASMKAPDYMPVTRDLSTARRKMLLKWLGDGSHTPVYMNLDSAESLRHALQRAVELEHATLPPYLTALFSLKPGRNTEVADLIRSVAMEEMLHMGLAANVLVSIGGHPSINHPGFVPDYPGPLPGGLAADLTVHLRRCSIEQVRDVFMAIEEPKETHAEVRRRVTREGVVEHHQYTIGWFYDQIRDALQRLAKAKKITFGNAKQQVAGPLGLFAVTSLADALHALETIVEQGEGASPLDPDTGLEPEELSHYYKYAEIVAGRRIVIDEDGDGFSYTGAPIPFDPDGVYPMMDDPSTTQLPYGSLAARLSAQFDQTYLALLNRLHESWNGNPDAIDGAFSLMYSLEVQAQALMQTPVDDPDGPTAGPAFQLPYPL